MSESYKRTVEAVIDNIIENNDSFKLKSFIEQDKEKDAMAKAINSSLSILNETGKELVLRELLNPDNKRLKGIIDDAGNINIIELTKQTTNEAIDLIKAAEKEGINLRQGAPVFKDSKATGLNGVITLAAMNVMINNYDNLSYEEKKSLVDNFNNMTTGQQIKLLEITASRIDDLIRNAKTQEEQDELKRIKETRNLFEELIKACEKQDFERMKQLIEKNPSLIEYYNTSHPNKPINLGTNVTKFPTEFKEFIEEGAQQVIKHVNRLDRHRYLSSKGKLNLEEQEELVSLVEEIDKFEQTPFGNCAIHYNNSEDKELAEQLEQFWEIPNEGKDETKLTKLTPEEEEEIQNIPVALNKLNLSPEQIKEILTQYMSTLKSFDENDIENFNKWDIDIRKNKLNEFLIEDGIEIKVADILSKISFNDSLFNILGDKDKRQQFFEQLDQSLAQEINPNESVEFTGELKDVIDSYLKEQEEQSFEENEAEQPEQQSSTFNQETIRDELSAIPVALSNIEGIDKSDIIAGMQGYKQLLDSIDASSLQGKTDDEVLKILMSKSADIGLEGNANEILLMMSQIGFSKDGNMQIADILTEAKDVFVALVDEASKEENIDRAIQENQFQTPITDREATPGMRLLIEDLSFAKENENQLGDQVVANDGVISDTVSTSGTDDTQGSVTSSKLKPKNLLGLIISKNVRTSNIQNPEEIISEYNRDENDRTDKKENGDSEVEIN